MQQLIQIREQTDEHLRSTCCLDILCAEVVFDCKGNSIQRTSKGT